MLLKKIISFTHEEIAIMILSVADLFGLTANHGVQVAFDGGKLPNITDSIAQLIFV